MSFKETRFLRLLDDFGRRLSKVENSPQLAFSSIQGGAIKDYSPDGELMGQIGLQPDGTHGAVAFSGPIPPAPTPPLLEASPGSLTATWDGLHEGGVPTPLDHKHIEVYVSQEPFAFIEDGILVGTLVGEDGDRLSASVVMGDWYVGLVAVTTSGKRSQLSQTTMAEVVAPADGTQVQFAVDAGVAAQEAADAAFESADDARTKAEAAVIEAATAAGIAAGKGKVILRETAPTGDDRNASNLWIRTPDNVPHTWSGTAWVARTDKAALDAAALAAQAAGAADTARQAAEAAQAQASDAAVSASEAQASADSTITWSTAAPTSDNIPANPNAVWMRRDSSGRVIGQWQWTGTAWVARQIENALIANLDAGKVVTGTLIAGVIGVTTLRGKVLEGGIVRTSATVGAIGGGQGVIFDTAGIRAHKATGQQTFKVDAATGAVTVNGEFLAGEPGFDRIRVGNIAGTSNSGDQGGVVQFTSATMGDAIVGTAIGAFTGLTLDANIGQLYLRASGGANINGPGGDVLINAERSLSAYGRTDARLYTSGGAGIALQGGFFYITSQGASGTPATTAARRLNLATNKWQTRSGSAWTDLPEIEATSKATVAPASGWDVAPNYAPMVVRKTGDEIKLSGTNLIRTSDLPVGGAQWHTVATIPTGFRPATRSIASGAHAIGGNFFAGRWIIEPSGALIFEAMGNGTITSANQAGNWAAPPSTFWFTS